MKKVYQGRLVGLSIFMAVIGILGFLIVGKDAFYVIMFFLLMWLFEYDLSSYDAKYDENGNKRVVRK